MRGKLTMTVVVADDTQRKVLDKVVEALPWVVHAPENAEHMGVLFYEPGPEAVQELAEIAGALENGSATDVVLVGEKPAPELLIEAMRGGIREYLPYPLEPRAVRDVLMRIRSRNVVVEGQESSGRVSVVLGARPGMGSTTLAVNLANVFAKAAPGRVLLADMGRPCGDVRFFLEAQCDYTWEDLLADASRLDETFLASAVGEGPDKLAVLAGPRNPAKPDPQAVHTLFETMRGAYDHVIVDAALESDGSLPTAAEQADDLLLVTELTMPALADAKRAVDAFRRADPEASRKLRVVASRVVKGGGVEPTDAAEALGCKIGLTLPGVFADASAAINQGVPLLTASPKSAYAKPVNEMARELGLPVARRGGLFSGLSGLLSRKGGRKSGSAGRVNA